MKFNHLAVEVKNRVAYLTIDRPPANALNRETFVGLTDCLDYIEQTDEIKVIVLTGVGRFFAAGADIKELTEAFGDAERGKALARNGQLVFDRIERFPKPIIAAINGICLGGGFELALSCHLRLAAEQAVIGLPELSLGLIPGFGGTQRLARAVPKAVALELLLTSRQMDGKEAERVGLVNETTPLAELMTRARQLAEQIALEKSGKAISALLRAVNEGVQLPLAQGQALESELFGQLFLTEDAEEGIRAFLEKRKAVFKDR